MNQQFQHKQLSSGNPLASALVIIAGIVIIAVSLALGFVVFLIIGGFMLAMAAVIGVRTWWSRQRFGKQNRGGRPQQRESSGETRVIEGEFHEVGSNDDNQHGR